MIGPVDLYQIKQQCGGTVYDGGRRWIGPGPGHSRRDASLSLCIADDGKLLLHSFAGDAFESCAALVVKHLGEGAAKLLGSGRDPGARADHSAQVLAKHQRERDAERRENLALAFCERLWAGGVPLEGSPGERYLAARGVGWFPPDVMFHPAAPRGYSASATAPALIALARSPVGLPKAVQATYLTRDYRTKSGRATFGALLGAAVRLGPAEGQMAVGEGLETCASFAELEGLTTWATLGTSNLEAFQPPSRCRHLVIAADGDGAGLKAATRLAERLRNRCDVSIRAAPPGADWNDVATGKAHV